MCAFSHVEFIKILKQQIFMIAYTYLACIYKTEREES